MMARELRVTPEGDTRSLGELFSELANETTTLIRQEVELAKAEFRQKAVSAGKDVGFIVVGGLLAYAGLLALIATVIIAIALALPWWLSALIVGVVVVGVGGALAMKGISSLKQGEGNPVPRQTIKTIQDDVRWAKEQTK
ncbi:MAG: phage holin family protein [Chloroflexota bacterium]